VKPAAPGTAAYAEQEVAVAAAPSLVELPGTGRAVIDPATGRKVPLLVEPGPLAGVASLTVASRLLSLRVVDVPAAVTAVILFNLASQLIGHRQWVLQNPAVAIGLILLGLLVVLAVWRVRRRRAEGARQEAEACRVAAVRAIEQRRSAGTAGVARSADSATVDDATWLGWTAVAARLNPGGRQHHGFDVGRWLAELGPSAPRVVFINANYRLKTRDVAVGEPINVDEQLVPPAAVITAALFLGVLILIPLSMIIMAAIAVHMLVAGAIAATLVALGGLAVFYGRAILAHVGVIGRVIEPGRITLLRGRESLEYSVADSVLVVERNWISGTLDVFVASTARPTLMVARGLWYSSPVISEVVLRWISPRTDDGGAAPAS
jgi:type II secretory pathway pseudopilin PulG